MVLMAAALAIAVIMTPTRVSAAPKAFTGAHIFPVAGEPLEDGVIIT